LRYPIKSNYNTIVLVAIQTKRFPPGPRAFPEGNTIVQSTPRCVVCWNSPQALSIG